MNDLSQYLRPVSAPIPTSGTQVPLVATFTLPATESAMFQALKGKKTMSDNELVEALVKLSISVLIRSESLNSDQPLDAIFSNVILALSLEKARAKEILSAHEKVLVDARALIALGKRLFLKAN
jgi:hypothetical protein